MYACAAVRLLVLLVCGAQFGTTYKILPPFTIHDSDVPVQKGEGIGTENKLPASFDEINLDYTVPDPAPFPEDEKLQQANNVFPMVPPLHPLFYGGSHSNGFHQFPTLGDDGYPVEPFRADYSYPHYHPAPHSVPPPSNPFVLEEVRYVPLVPGMPFYKPSGHVSEPQPPASTSPIPYLSTISADTVPTPSRIEEDMVRRIVQIVSNFQKPNVTQDEPAVREDSTSTIVTSDAVIVNASPVEENNNGTEEESSIEVSADETKTGDRPTRFVVAQFLDSNGNPCAKEMVMTAEKKTYYVYTCEERSLPVPQSTTLSSSIHHYRGELQTTTENVDLNLKGSVTTPMTPEDQTLPEQLSDYVMYNKQ